METPARLNGVGTCNIASLRVHKTNRGHSCLPYLLYSRAYLANECNMTSFVGQSYYADSLDFYVWCTLWDAIAGNEPTCLQFSIPLCCRFSPGWEGMSLGHKRIYWSNGDLTKKVMYHENIHLQHSERRISSPPECWLLTINIWPW